MDLLAVALGSLIVFLASWFYVHCARPRLALAGGNRIAFRLTLLASLVTVAGGLMIATVGLLDLPTALRRLGMLMVLAYAVPAIAFLRPRWLVRLTGGPDPSVPVRFVVCWYRRHWPDGAEGAQASRQFAEGMMTTLRDLEQPADPALVGRWLSELEGLIRAAGTGRATLQRHRQLVGDALGSVVPVDPAGRWLS